MQAEALVTELQQEVQRREASAMQLEHELKLEKERWNSAGAAATAGGAGGIARSPYAGSGARQGGDAGSGAGSVSQMPSTAGRKRRSSAGGETNRQQQQQQQGQQQEQLLMHGVQKVDEDAGRRVKQEGRAEVCAADDTGGDVDMIDAGEGHPAADAAPVAAAGQALQAAPTAAAPGVAVLQRDPDVPAVGGGTAATAVAGSGSVATGDGAGSGPALSLIPGMGIPAFEPTSWQKLWCSCSTAVQQLLALNPWGSTFSSTSSSSSSSMGTMIQGLSLQQGQPGVLASTSGGGSGGGWVECSTAAAALQQQLQPVAAGAAAVATLVGPLLQLLSALAALRSQGVAGTGPAPPAAGPFPAAGADLGPDGAAGTAAAAGLEVLQGMLQHDDETLETVILMLGICSLPGVLGQPHQQQQQQKLAEQQQQQKEMQGSGLPRSYVQGSGLFGGTRGHRGTSWQGADERCWSLPDAAAAVSLQLRSPQAAAAVDHSRTILHHHQQQQQQQDSWGVMSSSRGVGQRPLVLFGSMLTATAGAGGAQVVEGDFLSLLHSLARQHPPLLPQVGHVLAVLATRLSPTLQQLLLPVLSGGLTGQLLSQGSAAAKSSGLVVLQALLGCPGVAAAVASAARQKGSSEQQQQVGAAAAMGGEMCDGGSSRGTSSSIRGGAPGMLAATGRGLEGVTSPSDLILEPSVAAELIMSWLDCLAWVPEPAVAVGPHTQAGYSRSCVSSSSASRGLGLGGMWEVQRRAVAAAAAALQLRHLPLLLLLLGEELTGGEGLAQRLVALIDGASGAGSVDICKPVLPCAVTGGGGCRCCRGGSAAGGQTPEGTGAPAAIAAGGGGEAGAGHGKVAAMGTAAAVNQDGGEASAAEGLQAQVASRGCCGEEEFRQRVQLVHEAMLLLRTLVASPAAIGKEIL